MIGVIGLGFVGLTTALGFAHKTPWNVYGYEKDPARRRDLQQGSIPFYEPGLPEHLELYGNKKLFLPDTLEELVRHCRVLFFCVGTPTDEAGTSDLRMLLSAIQEVLDCIPPGEYKVLVVKSTVPPSTTQREVVGKITAHGLTPGKDIGLANNPEFLREGYSWEDFIRPDRIVVGQYDDRSGLEVAALYEPFGAPIYRVSLSTGEFIKYLSNTLLATLVSYSNEMAMAADAIGGIDLKSAFRILREDRRWSGNPAPMNSYVHPGCGFGGYCLPKDTQAFIAKAKECGFDTRGLRSTMATNSDIRRHTVQKVETLCTDRNSLIGVLGLSFKPGSDDVRDSTVRHILDGLLADGYANLLAYDPLAMKAFDSAYRYPIHYAASLREVLDRAEVLVLTTAWPEFLQHAEDIRRKKHVDARYCL